MNEVSTSDYDGRKPPPSPSPSEESLPSSSNKMPSGWCPRQVAFRPYHPSTAVKPQALRVVVRRPLVARLTKYIVETYQLCNPEFRYSEEFNPKRFLTSPADGVLNDGLDNANSDLILNVNYVLTNSHTQQRYIVKDILGHGTFGQVAKCWVPENNSFVAVKIIKNQPAYYQQAWVEVSILTTLNKKFDPEDKHHIVRIYDYFVFRQHLCISFELLDTNLYELIKMNSFKGLSLSIVQLFSKQILRGLGLMKNAGIIHCDLKPENILLCTSVKPAEIKIIDFGSACMEDRTVYSYIQSRYYRSPEVLLGYQYTTAIDMWSFGCIVAELFLGLPLFPGASEFDLLRRMIRILGGQPPDYLLKEAKNTGKFFKFIGNIGHLDSGRGRSAYQPLTDEEFEGREKKKPTIGKEYFNYMNLEGIIAAYPYRKNLPEEDIIKERQVRFALVDFLRGLVEFDPTKRWSPLQASKHPFVTGEPFNCPYNPPPETPRMPVSQNFKVDHHPGGGHWFAAGLSPNIPGRTLNVHAGSHLQMPPYAHGSSYGSLGSHSSYNDCNGLASSYGSYGENANMFTYFSPVGPSAMNYHPQGGMPMVGTSPDTRWRLFHRPQGLGVSPSAGNFAPLPLGASPSQFTPPNAYTQVSSSPGHYGSASPARGSCQGSPLGKGASVSHFSRRKSWGYSGSLQPSEAPSSSYWQGQLAENSSCNSVEGVQGSSMHDTCMHVSQTQGVADEKLDHAALPDPGDWDPNYSDEQLLQEDDADTSAIASEFSKLVHIDQAITSVQTPNGLVRLNHDTSANANSSTQRLSGSMQGSANPEVGSPPSIYNLPPSYGRSISKNAQFLPQLSPTSPSRLGQLPIQRPSLERSSVLHGNDGAHVKLHGSLSNIPAIPQPVAGSSFSNGTPWGRRKNTLVNFPPSPGRKDYGRIT